jgi:hypothetical protein
MPRSTSKEHLKRREKRATLVKAASKKTERSPPESLPEQGPGLETLSMSGYAIGDPISHSQFGDGVITAIDGEKLTIKFTDGRVKQILDYYVKRRPR